MEERININVSATNYDQSSDGIRSILRRLEEMVHEEDGFVITDSEFAFGWHFYIVSVNKILVEKLAEQIGDRFQKIAKFSEDHDESKYWKEFFCHFSCCIFVLPQRNYIF